MKPIFVFLTMTLVLGACQSKKKDSKEEYPESTVAQSPEGAKLTDAQKAEGWVLLFDGKTLSGWRTFKNLTNGTWEVHDGMLHSKPFDKRTVTEHADLMTDDEYENFELSIDWKITPKANAGVMYRVTEEFKEPYLSGPEYQIVDDLGYGELKPTNTTAGVYDMYAPKIKTLRPVGEWNTTRIIVSGNKVEHWLNDKRIISYELGSPDWKKRKNGSKWNDAAGYGAAKKGHIDLQDHGDEVWYRNILVRVL